MIGIYKITNKLNGKSYIGQSIDIKRRWREHKNNIGSNKNPLYLDFQRYGIDNFSFEVLEKCEREKLDGKEIQYIKQFNTYREGYNLTIGGQGDNTTSTFKRELFQEMDYYKTITPKQWKVYYYLLSISKFDSQNVEKHRYVYKNALNITQSCKDIGIKSRKTFYNALERLEEYNLIRQTATAYLIYSGDWVEIDRKVLINLLNYSISKEQDIDLLRMFLILKKIFKIADSKEDMSFTQRNLVMLLGHAPTDSTYYNNVRTYLALLSYWGLIEVKLHTEYDEKLGRYIIYHLQNVKEKELSPDFETDIEAEKYASGMSNELFEKVMFKMPLFFKQDS